MKYKEICNYEIERCLKAGIKVMCLDKANEELMCINDMLVGNYLLLNDDLASDEHVYTSESLYHLYVVLNDGQKVPTYEEAYGNV